MPIHDFRCQACGHTFETLVRGSAMPVCPKCAGTALDKLVSLTAAQGTSAAIVASARRAAAREGHFSNYTRAERAKLPK
jgi:putative FmdB family regulatory protein